MTDLLDLVRDRGGEGYTAHDIEVLEGLEPVRRRPGMYIGGTDERALHHLAAEVLDNAMDEAVAGHASRIELELAAPNRLTVRDNGRGIPVDPHPKFPGKTALEVIMTTLHSGGKFGSKAYATSGGLHGVGVWVVNALSERAHGRGRAQQAALRPALCPRRAARAAGAGRRRAQPPRHHRHLHPRPRDLRSRAPLLARLLHRWRAPRPICSAASRSAGAAIPRCCPPRGAVPAEESFQFPQGLADFLKEQLDGRELVVDDPFTGEAALEQGGRVEWAVAWPIDEEPYAG